MMNLIMSSLITMNLNRFLVWTRAVALVLHHQSLLQIQESISEDPMLSIDLIQINPLLVLIGQTIQQS
jgi:hypothetical protein